MSLRRRLRCGISTVIQWRTCSWVLLNGPMTRIRPKGTKVCEECLLKGRLILSCFSFSFVNPVSAAPFLFLLIHYVLFISLQCGGPVCSQRAGAVEESHAGVCDVHPVWTAVQRPAVTRGPPHRQICHHRSQRQLR